MNCGKCGSEDVARSRRQGPADAIRAALGFWPYRCADCDARFYSRFRYPGDAARQAQKRVRQEFYRTPHDMPGKAFRAEAAAGPAMAFRTSEQRPQARIVVEADSHEQLNNILLALDRAVHSYQHASQAQTETAGRGR